MTQPLNALSLALSVISLTFFLVACIGYSDNEDTLQNVSWAVYDENGVQQWFGLRSYAMKANIYGTSVDGTADYSDCGGNTCDSCDQDGKSSFGLMIIALVFATVCAALSGTMIGAASSTMQIANVIMAFIAFGASLVSVGVFMGGCYTDLKDNYSDGDKLTWGPGSILSIIGMLIMFMVTVFQIAAVAIGDGNLPTPVPNKY